MSRTIDAAQFKEQCLAILEQVDHDGVVITKHGHPVAKLIPVEGTSEHLIGCLRGKLKPAGPPAPGGMLNRDSDILADALEGEFIAAASVVHQFPLVTRAEDPRLAARAASWALLKQHGLHRGLVALRRRGRARYGGK